jgi:hypothetical protein
MPWIKLDEKKVAFVLRILLIPAGQSYLDESCMIISLVT